MDPEIVIGVVAVFVSGGAIGAVGTLLAQWCLRQLGAGGKDRKALEDREMVMLREEVAALSRLARNLKARVDFQEQLLGGALHPPQAPPRLAEGDQPESP